MSSIVASGRLRVGWGGPLGNTMRLRLKLTPSAADGPLTDMTTVTAVDLYVLRGDGTTVDTWTCSILGSPSTELTTWVYLFGASDLTEEETLTCTALMTTTPGSIVPSVPFELFVDP